MPEHVGELSLGREKNLKRPTSAEAIDTPPGKLRKTTHEDTERAGGLHNLVIDTEDATKLASDHRQR